MFLAFLEKAGWGSWPRLRFVQGFLGALTAVSLYFQARLCFRRFSWNGTAGIWAAVLAAVWPPLIVYAARAMTETLFLFLLQSGMVLVLAAERGLRGGAPAGGVLLGAAALCRPVILPFLPAALFWLALPGVGGRRCYFRAGWFAAAAVVVLTPWTWRNFRLFGALVPVATQSGNILYLANNPVATGGTGSIARLIESGVYHTGEKEDEIAYSRAYGSAALKHIAADPRRFLSLSRRRLIWFLHLDGHGNVPAATAALWTLFILAAVGMAVSRRSPREIFLPLFLILEIVVTHMIVPPEGRYRLAMMPQIMLFAAAALAWAVVPAGDER